MKLRTAKAIDELAASMEEVLGEVRHMEMLHPLTLHSAENALEDVKNILAQEGFERT